MYDKIRARVIDLLTLVAAIGVLLAGLYLYGTIRRHHALVDALIGVVEAQQQRLQEPAEAPAEVP